MNHASRINVALVIIAVGALLFGAYGFIAGQGSQDGKNLGLNESLENSESIDASTNELKDRLVQKDNKIDSLNDEISGLRQKLDEARSKKLNSSSSTPDGAEISGDALIKGKVLYSNGSPASGVQVLICATGSGASTPPIIKSAGIEEYRLEVMSYISGLEHKCKIAKSLNDGSFTIPNLDGTLSYDITASTRSGASANVTNIATGDVIVIRLPNTKRRLSGKINVSSGTLPPTCEVEIRSSLNEVLKEQITPNNPQFDIVIPQAGSWNITIKAVGFYLPEPVKVVMAESAKSVNILLEPSGYLSGIVKDETGSPLSEVQVTLTDQVNPNTNSRRSGKTNSLGRYRFDSLPPSTYLLTTRYGELNESEVVTVMMDDNESDITLEATSGLSIRVSDAQGSPIDVGRIYFQRVVDGVAGSWFNPSRLPTRESGLIEFKGIKLGEIQVMLYLPDGARETKTLTIESGNNQLDVQLSAACYITGKAVFQDGSFPGKNIVYVSAKPADDTESTTRAPGASYTQEDGTFKVGPLAPGEWTLELSTYAGGAQKVLHSEKIMVSEGDNETSVTLDKGGSVKVKVEHEDGKAASSMDCYVTLTQKSGRPAYGYLDSEGIAQFQFLEDGKYTLNVQPSGTAQYMVEPQEITVAAGVSNEMSLTLKKANCLKVTSINADSNASKSGMINGDVILDYKGESVKSIQDLIKLIKGTTADDTITLTVDRDGSVVSLQVSGGRLGINATGHWSSLAR